MLQIQEVVSTIKFAENETIFVRFHNRHVIGHKILELLQALRIIKVERNCEY